MSNYTSFPKDALAFLTELKANNRKDWFAAQKPRYEAAIKLPAQAFTDAVCFRMKAMTDRDWQAKIFRIYRDVRFSKDKTPYNAHLHILFREEGRSAGLFFGLRPNELVLGAGVFKFDDVQLPAYRASVAGPKGAELADLVTNYQSAGLRLNEPPLKRVPKGFPADHPRADLLKRKGFALWQDRPDPEIMLTPDGIQTCFDTWDHMSALRMWMNTNIPPEKT
ncbi:MAG: DUF2461 domain-containing protein [Henriciella sp.]